MLRRAFLSARAAAIGLMAAALPAIASSQRQRREPEAQARRTPVKHARPKSRPVDVTLGADYLGKRSLHPGHSSSIRKLQRAFRLAGTHFVVGTHVSAKGRSR